MVGTIENAVEKGRRVAGDEGGASPSAAEGEADAERKEEPEPAGVS
jgi:hypothetical protein